jgi:16S rRNA (guanine527-N7)-methyltransferase
MGRAWVYNQNPAMHTARIAKLLEPFLEPAHPSGPRVQDLVSDISTYVDILLRWNARINLTAVRNEGEILTRHFGESLFVARQLFPAGPNHPSKTTRSSSAPSTVKAFEVADLGSGAGFPGLPIKLWAPNIALTLIESNHKKATFLREVTRALAVTDVNIQNTRAETLPAAMFDVVTLRAVERFIKVLPVAANLLAPNGRLVLLLASSQLDDARSTLPAVTWDAAIPIPQSESRLLLVGTVESKQ